MLLLSSLLKNNFFMTAYYAKMFLFFLFGFIFKNFNKFTILLKEKSLEFFFRLKQTFIIIKNFFFMRNNYCGLLLTGYINDDGTIEFLDQTYASLDHYVFLSFSVQIFLFGLVGTAFNKRNFVSLLLSIEIMFLGLGLLFIGFSSLKSTLVNFSMPLLILGISACETALGLSILIFMYKFGWQTDNFLFKNLQTKTLSNFQESYDGEGSYKKKIISDNLDVTIVTTNDKFLKKKISHFCLALIFVFSFSEYYEAARNFYNDKPFFLMKNFDYIYVVFFFLTSFLFLSLLVFVTRILALYKPTRQKLSSYECGFEPFSDSRGKQDVLFYVVAILFILFDVELIFIIP